MDPTSTSPMLVRAPRDSDTMEIEWADGHVSRYPNALLRAYCPCAGCQGHSGEIKYLPGGNDSIEAIDEAGNYGLTFRWGDGHDSGIYTYRYLRRLCACDRCLPGSPHARHEALAR